MTGWKRVINYLNGERKVQRSVFYGDNFKILSSTMDEYLYLLHKCGYLEFSFKHVKTSKSSLLRGLYSEYCVLQRKIPENLTITDAIKIKKQPWLGWFKYYDKKNKL